MASGHIQATAQALKSHVIIVLLIEVVKKNDSILVLGRQTSTLDHLRWSFRGFVSGWMPDTTSNSLTYIR